MHDLTFANEILYVLKREVDKLGVSAHKRPIIVNVALSPFSHVKPEGLQETFSTLLEGKEYASVKLNVKPMEFQLFCKGCRELIKTSEPVMRCPACKSTDLDTQIKKEFFIESIEVEET